MMDGKGGYGYPPALSALDRSIGSGSRDTDLLVVRGFLADPSTFMYLLVDLKDFSSLRYCCYICLFVYIYI